MVVKFVSLVSEDNESLSMGRIAFWILLVACFIYWFYLNTKTFPSTLYEMTLFVLLYNFSKKGVDAFSEWVKYKQTMGPTPK